MVIYFSRESFCKFHYRYFSGRCCFGVLTVQLKQLLTSFYAVLISLYALLAFISHWLHLVSCLAGLFLTFPVLVSHLLHQPVEPQELVIFFIIGHR
jgi:hypothetical protein